MSFPERTKKLFSDLSWQIIYYAMKKKETHYLQKSLISFKKITSRPLPITTLGHFIDNPNLMDQLVTVGTSSHPPWGVNVYYSPDGTGKSTYLKKACQLIQQSNLADVIYIENLKPFNKDLYGVLKSHCGFSDDHHLLSYSLQNHKRKVVIAIDHFDTLCSFPNLKGWTTSLAEESSNAKKIVTIVAVSDPIIALNVSCWNGGEKFRLIQGQMWSTQQIQSYIDSVLPQDDQFWKLQERRHLIELAMLSKNPRFINGLMNLQNPSFIFDENLFRLAQKYENSWKIGSDLTSISSRIKNFKD